MAARFFRAEVVVLGFLAAAGLGGNSEGAATADERLRSLAGRRDVLRIGLEAADSVVVEGVGGPFRILDPASGEAVWRGEFDGPVAVVPVGTGSRPASRFRMQIGSYADRDTAEAERSLLESRYGAPAVATFDPDRGVYRVRIGDATDREDLGPLRDRLRTDGRAGMWIVEEPVSEVRGATLRIVDTRTYDSHPVASDRVVFVPGAASSLSTSGKSYRGILEVRTTRYGTVRPINWVEIESYLRGVVPAELGPEVWPEIEALKAQAIAARTYAWRHRGQFEEDDFDLCATPRCQAYGGQASEHPLSDRAVAETRGEILTWSGQPATTLYTATCGGHTEDAAKIFPEERAPYLRGVPCFAEREGWGAFWVEGRAAESVRTEDGEDLSRDRAVLVAAGILEPEVGAAALGEPLLPGEVERWSARLLTRAGLRSIPARRGSVTTRGQAAVTLVDALGWNDRVRVLLQEPDLAALLRDPDTDQLPDAERRALAYLGRLGWISPDAAGNWAADRPASRAFVVRVLAGAGETYGALGLRTAVVAGLDGRTLRVVRGKSEVREPLSEDVVLFGWSGGRATAGHRLRLWPGDRVRYRTAENGTVELIELLSPVKGASDDRSAEVHSWDERVSGRELQSTLGRRVQVGVVRDLEVVQRGVSGRVTELRVVGDRGSEVIRGFDIRRALELKETLVTFEIQRDAAGQIAAVVFSGKGWGHGVGMCQVGAYGMAVRGANYREILGHYYPGTLVADRSATNP